MNNLKTARTVSICNIEVGLWGNESLFKTAGKIGMLFQVDRPISGFQPQNPVAEPREGQFI